jgi:segregation and condensation protein A
MTFLLSNEETYQVKLPLFEGPLDLLLHLIEREELDITKISLAQVTDQYLAYIAQLEELHPEILADFLVVAARLLLIKSQVLLPRPETALPSDDEEDPGEALARQLREYKRFKKVAQHLKERSATGARAFVRLAPPPKLARKVDLSDVTLSALLATMRQALAAQLADETLPAAPSQPTVTLDDQIALLRQRLLQQGHITFSSLLTKARSRLEVIITFLAVLEMFKALEITLHQDGLFGEIDIRVAPPSNGQVAPSSPASSEEGEEIQPNAAVA